VFHKGLTIFTRQFILIESMTFEEIIHPISLKEFFEEYYEKKMLHIPRQNSAYYHRFIHPNEIDLHLQLKQTYSPNVKVLKDGKFIPPVLYSSELKGVGAYVAQPMSLLQMYRDGCTLKYDKLQLTYPPIAEKVSKLEKELDIKIRTSVYLTPKNSRGAGLHTDSHDVLALQINGSKTWKVKFCEVALPSSYTNILPENWEEDIETIVLKAGDFFYCPRGLAHEVFTEDQSSIHFTIGFQPVYGYNLVKKLGKIAYKNDFFRKALPSVVSTNEERETYKTEFMIALQQLLEDDVFDEITAIGESSKLESQLKMEKGTFLTEIYTPNQEDKFKVNADWTLVKTNFGCVVTLNSLNYNFPINFFEALTFISTQKEIQFNEISVEAEEKVVTKFVKRLLSIGILVLS
jgi:ribosomal protein L16 Arg81 hydroxylase